MTDQKDHDDITNNGGMSKTVGFALLAGVLGLAVGAGLYAFMGDNGNTSVAGGTVSATAESTCTYNEDERKKLDAAAGGQVAAFRALDRPYSVSSMSFKDKDGSTKTMADWKGKTVLLNLWATWCAPCRAEMPALDELHATLGGEKFEVLPISVDLGDAGKPKRFYSEINISHMGFYHDPEMNTFNDLRKDGLTTGLPATLLIDEGGCVLGTLNGPAEWAGEDAQKLIKAAF